MSEYLRTTAEVIEVIGSTLLATDPVGVAIEPMATMQDPYNDVDGDTVIRACHWTDKPDGLEDEPDKTYCVVFEAFIHMNRFRTMSEDHLRRNMDSMLKAVAIHLDKPTSNAEYMDSKGIHSLSGMKHTAEKARHKVSKNWPGLKD